MSYPFILKPAHRQHLWGGSRISNYFRREEALPNCAESWECSDREEGMCFIRNGAYKGYSLKELLRKRPDDFDRSDSLPFLIKIIDAALPLSVQVHPGEKGEGEPKNEAWYVLDALPGSFIYLGFRHAVSERMIRESIAGGFPEKYMNRIEVQKGDVFYVPSGVVHSIGAGCLLYEVQQNSDTTYRLYDWNRVDSSGNKRELHIERALRVLHKEPFHPPGFFLPQRSENTEENGLIETPYFSLKEYRLTEEREFNSPSHCKSWFVVEGSFRLEYEGRTEILVQGGSCLLPRGCPKFCLVPLSSFVHILEASPK